MDMYVFKTSVSQLNVNLSTTTVHKVHRNSEVNVLFQPAKDHSYSTS